MLKLNKTGISMDDVLLMNSFQTEKHPVRHIVWRAINSIIPIIKRVSLIVIKNESVFLG